MEFNDLLGDKSFIKSYNKISRVKGRIMEPKVKKGGCYFELNERKAHEPTEEEADE